jgi:hypothetical protein
MDFDLLLLRGLDGFAAVFACVFFYQRFRWRRNKRLGKSNWGFYPSSAALGNALQELQTMAQPQVQHVLEEKSEDTAEDDDEAGPDDPTAHLRNQAERIRRGDRLDRVTVRLR